MGPKGVGKARTYEVKMVKICKDGNGSSLAIVKPGFLGYVTEML